MIRFRRIGWLTDSYLREIKLSEDDSIASSAKVLKDACPRIDARGSQNWNEHFGEIAATRWRAGAASRWDSLRVDKQYQLYDLVDRTDFPISCEIYF